MLNHGPFPFNQTSQCFDIKPLLFKFTVRNSTRCYVTRTHKSTNVEFQSLGGLVTKYSYLVLRNKQPTDSHSYDVQLLLKKQWNELDKLQFWLVQGTQKSCWLINGCNTLFYTSTILSPSSYPCLPYQIWSMLIKIDFKAKLMSSTFCFLLWIAAIDKHGMNMFLKTYAALCMTSWTLQI